ncbi:MAG TPA: glycoside hydrolase family 15 protein [Hyphomicrobiaceae bacterium]|nr:glycoside hydrolase family 15 protein [Hyphomicrobiaceae bacterium]
MAGRIEDYALIGDCETAALVGSDGSIDWLCWPRFDSGAVFAALVGDCDNGHWQIAPTDASARRSRRYRGNTLVLETELVTADGAATLIEFMPLRAQGTSHIVRIVQGRRGRVAMHTRLILRFDYGSIVPWVTRLDDNTIKAIAGPDMAVLRTNVDLKADGFSHRAQFSVAAGETATFVLGYGPSFHALPEAIAPLAALAETEQAWGEWTAGYRPAGRYAEEVLRSLITLKALTYRPTGGIVAAPTTSLPENPGGSRNWDYRYCWLRDATFTLLALMNGGFEGEAEAWRTWLQHAVAGNPAQVQIMYGLAGERRLDEWEIANLSGYQGARPVRIGNAAAKQLQIDIFGEVMDALFQSADGGLAPESTEWNLQVKLVEHLETIWQEPDQGLWEVRGGPRQFTHSKVMAWVALDRAVKSIESFHVKGPLARWRKLREQIHAEVCERGYNPTLGAFVQSYGTTDLDASALLIPLVGFLPPHDPRVSSTLEAIRRHLMVEGLVHRYDTHRSADGLPAGEGAFLACSFWFADNLVLLGRRQEAQELFEHLLTLRNDVGLLAEEYDPVAKRMLGNFPQAFSHVALINTAYNLAKPDKPAEQRSGARPSPGPAQPLPAKPG